jgi:hypothetical protein
MKFAGLILKDNIEEDSILVVAGPEETKKWRLKTNQEIVEALEDEDVEILAANVGMKQGREEFTKKEEELKDEGYSFIPSGHQVKKMKRLESLGAHLEKEIGVTAPDIIRFNRFISAEELAIHDDEALESLGFDTSEIESSDGFDAMLGAVTARYYEQGDFRDLGIIVPGEESEQKEEDTPKDPREEPKS